MKFLLLAYGDEQKSAKLTQADMAALGKQCGVYDEELKKTGRLVGSGSLDWGAKTLRLKKGKLTITDGPFIEAKELVGGFVIIEAADYEDALKIAALHPAARMGEELGWAVELRPMGHCELKVAAGIAT
jgi:hypothetical protein